MIRIVYFGESGSSPILVVLSYYIFGQIDYTPFSRSVVIAIYLIGIFRKRLLLPIDRYGDKPKYFHYCNREKNDPEE